jgi:hypothetical protein
VFSELPLPPAAVAAPNIVEWPAGKQVYRVYNGEFGATEFNPGLRGNGGRFHPIRTAGGASIPTIYGSNTIDGALSETVFHDVPVTGPAKRVAQAVLMKFLICTLASKRDLRLIELKGHGLRKLEVTRAQLIDTDADQYNRTRRWAEALYERDPTADGLLWMSRQHDSSEALVLFGSRVDRGDLHFTEAPRGLYPPSLGWLDVIRAAEAAGITVDSHEDDLGK